MVRKRLLACRPPDGLWESGSEHHLPTRMAGAAPRYPWGKQASFYGSGRDALRGLLEHGRRQLGWARLWVPSFFCQEVVGSLLHSGLEIRLYEDDPLRAVPDWGLIDPAIGDAILVMNYYGIRAGAECPLDLAVIEDHSHALLGSWATESRADWCAASLRKTLPLPDGGVIWSPRGHNLPSAPPPSSRRRAASAEKLAAMLLKQLYLNGRDVDKSVFRAASLRAEDEIAAGRISGMAEWSRELLQNYPVQEWQADRASNHAALAAAVEGFDSVRVLVPASDSAVFMVALWSASPRLREKIRSALIGDRIYPAVLWSLEEMIAGDLAPGTLEISRRILLIHCDHRYGAEDMERIAASLLRATEDEP